MTKSRVFGLLVGAVVAGAAVVIVAYKTSRRPRTKLGKHLLVVDRRPRETVEGASEDSFPASDPPAWTGTGV